ncbi:MAG: LamG-like jellyroll fold domain-containing protein [Candidatus Absconditabacteria bacterium]
MAKKLKKLLKSFTLIELIIVIAVIAVLGVAAFLVLSQWMSKSRDSRRIADFHVIKNALDISFVDKSYYPLPDENILVKDKFGGLGWIQGAFSNKVVSSLNSIQKPPFDPKSKLPYDYSVTPDGKEYEIRVFVENFVSNRLISQSFASKTISNIVGNYKKYLLIKSPTNDIFIWNVKNLFCDEIDFTLCEINDSSILSIGYNNQELGYSIQLSGLNLTPLFNDSTSNELKQVLLEDLKKFLPNEFNNYGESQLLKKIGSFISEEKVPYKSEEIDSYSGTTRLINYYLGNIICGDGKIEGSEQCDDGNKISGDGCSGICKFEIPSCQLTATPNHKTSSPLVSQISGSVTNGGFFSKIIINGVETIDPLLPLSNSFTNGVHTITGVVVNHIDNTVSSDCSIKVNVGSIVCGNGVKEGIEECDDGNLINYDGCSSTCVKTFTPILFKDSSGNNVFPSNCNDLNIKKNQYLAYNKYETNNLTTLKQISLSQINDGVYWMDLDGMSSNEKYISDDETSILINSDEVNGSTTVNDSSKYANNITNTSVVNTSSTKKTGTSSLNFPTNSMLTVTGNPSNNELDFGSGDFTIDFWMNPTLVSGTYNLISKRSHQSSYDGYIILISNGLVKAYFSSNGTSWDIANPLSCGNVKIGSWYHVAVVRSNNNILCFNNGLLTSSISTTKSIFSNNQPIRIGKDSNGLPFTGYMDEIRISKGSGRRTSNFSLDLVAPLPVSCDMTKDGGGWTQIGNFSSCPGQDILSENGFNIQEIGNYQKSRGLPSVIYNLDSLKTTGIKVITNNYHTNGRFFKPSCFLNIDGSTQADCRTSYSSINWTNPVVSAGLPNYGLILIDQTNGWGNYNDLFGIRLRKGSSQESNWNRDHGKTCSGNTSRMKLFIK